jgi:hypothetical protein
MKGKAILEEVLVEHENVQPMKQTKVISIEVQQQLYQHVPTTIECIEYMTTPIISQSIMFHIATTRTISLD